MKEKPKFIKNTQNKPSNESNFNNNNYNNNNNFNNNFNNNNSFNNNKSAYEKAYNDLHMRRHITTTTKKIIYQIIQFLKVMYITIQIYTKILTCK